MSIETLNPRAADTSTPIEAAISANAAEARSRKTLDDRIEETEAELKRLKEARRKKESEDRERNERDLRSLLVAEKLTLTPSAIWRKALPEIKAALARAAAS